MKLKRAWLGLFIVLAVVAAACADDTTDTTAAPGTTAAPATTAAPDTTAAPSPDTTVAAGPKTIIIGTTDSIAGLDSADAYAVHDWELIRNTNVGLTAFSPGTVDLVPGVASSWDVSNEGKTYTFHLRDGVAFYDGTALTAPDYVTHINRMLELEGDGGVGGALGKPYIESVEATDDSTVVINLLDAFAYFPQVVTGAPYMPMHPSYPVDALVEFPEAPFGGVGPYVVTEYTIGEQTVLERNPNYFGDPPAVERIIIVYFTEAAQLVAALQAGDIDVAWRSVQEPDLLEAVGGTEGVSGAVVPGGPIRYLIVNRTLDPTTDQRVRQAIAASIDRDDLVDNALGGNATPLYSPIPPGYIGSNEAYDTAYGSPNQELVATLMTDAGFSESVPLELTIDYPPNRYGGVVGDAMQLLKTQLEATGFFAVETQATEWATYLGNVITGESYAVSFLGWFFDYPDSSNWVEPFTFFGGLGTRATDPDNVPAAGHADLVTTMQAASVETDSAARAALYQQVQDLYADLIVTIPLWVEPERVFYKNCVSGNQNIPNPASLNIGPDTNLNYETLDTSC